MNATKKPKRFDSERLEHIAEALTQHLDQSLTWDDLTDSRRQELTRACNAAELALALIYQNEVRDSVKV